MFHATSQSLNEMKATPNLSDPANITEIKHHADGTVGKALNILDIVENFGKPVRFVQIMKHSPYPKPTTFRFLQTLTRQRMLALNPDTGHYSLGVRLMRLAHSAWKQASLAPIAAPFLDQLSKKTGETIHLAQLDGAQVLYLDKRNAIRPVSMFSDAGKIGPAYCTGVGKAMMAFLETDARKNLIAQQSFFKYTENSITSAQQLEAELKQIRSARISFDREEHEPNIICIASPILTPSGRVIGGISITSSTNRVSLENLQDYSDDLKSTADKIGEAAFQWMFPDTGGNI